MPKRGSEVDQRQGNEEAAGSNARHRRKVGSAYQKESAPRDGLVRPSIKRSPFHVDSYGDPHNRLLLLESKGTSGDTVQHGSTRCRFWIVSVLALTVGIIVLYVFTREYSLPDDSMSSSVTEKCNPRKRSERSDVLMHRMTGLRKRFLSLDAMSWNVIGASSWEHVSEDMNPDRPVVLLLVGHPGADTGVRMFALHVADMYAEVFAVHHNASDIAHIEGARLEGQSADDAKLSLEKQLKSGLSGCTHVTLVSDFDKVPPCSAILFHAYCDNDSAPYKDAVIILTMTLEEALGNTDLRDKRTDEAIRSHLEKRWTKCPEEIPPDKTEAMFSRVANNVVIMK